MESFTKQSNDVTTSGRSDSSAVGSLQKCEFHTNSGYSHPSEDDAAYAADDLTQTVRPKVACITEVCDQQPSTTTSTFTEDLQAEADQSELRDKHPATTTLTSADFNVLDELTEDLLVAAVKRSLNVPPQSLCPIEEQSSFISRDSDSIESSEMNVPWIFKPSHLDNLREFEEVSSEIRNANSKYGKHLPPLPLCLASEPEIERMPPITLNTEDSDCMASDHLENNVQLLTTTDSQRPSGEDGEPDVQIKRPILSEKFGRCDKLCSDITAENSKCFIEQNSPFTEHVVEETRLQPIAASAIEISKTKVKSAITEQLNDHVTPVQIQLLDAQADDYDLFPDEVVESTTIISIAVAKSDGDGLESATNTIQVKSAAAEKPRQGRRRSFLSALGRRLLKFGRTLCCCGCCK
ncbi:hypothetical protein QTP88_018230 [Uroleucon formosanum]